MNTKIRIQSDRFLALRIGHVLVFSPTENADLQTQQALTFTACTRSDVHAETERTEKQKAAKPATFGIFPASAMSKSGL